MLTAVLLAGAAVSSPQTTRAQFNMPGAEPVPPEYLRGDTLVVEGLNFRAVSPGPGWRWVVKEDGQWITYHALDEARGDVYSIIVSESLRSPLNTRFIDRYMASVVQSWTDRGGVVDEVSYIPSLIPTAGSYLVKYRTVGGEGRPIYWTSYICKIGRFYVFQSYSRRADPPPAFLDFLDSFAVLRPVEEEGGTVARRRIFFPPFLVINLGLLGVGLLAGRLSGLGADEPRLNGAVVGGVLIVASYCIELVLLFRVIGLVTGLPGVDQGKIFGRVIGDLVLPFGAAVFLFLRGRRIGE